MDNTIKNDSDDNYVYLYKNSIYINLTNRCNNDCTFCIRNKAQGIGDDKLWIDYEPNFEKIKPKLDKLWDNNTKDNQIYGNEVVFCGYGESTYALDTMLKVADYCHQNNYTTRLNTNGLGASIHKITNQQLVSKLIGKIDKVSISLLAANSDDYNKLARPNTPNAFPQLLDFAQECKKQGLNTRFTIVDILQPDKKAQIIQLCQDLDIELKIRDYIK